MRAASNWGWFKRSLERAFPQVLLRPDARNKKAPAVLYVSAAYNTL